MHKQYPKIYRLWTEWTDWILNYPLLVQSKLDWANLSVRKEEWDLKIWSRTQTIYEYGKMTKWFRWAQEYITNHKWIQWLLEDHPSYRLYWERLVSHTIKYPEHAYNNFYMFDIFDEDKQQFLDPLDVVEIAIEYGIDKPDLISWYRTWTIEELNDIAMNSKDFWVSWEWIVLKPLSFINKFWDRSYAKIIKPEFKEENSIVFGNVDKQSKEDEFSSKFVNEARVLKIVNKIEQNEERNIRIEDTPKVIGMVYHDVFSEELRDFVKKDVINFWDLQNKCSKRTRYLFHRYLNSDLPSYQVWC